MKRFTVAHSTSILALVTLFSLSIALQAQNESRPLQTTYPTAKQPLRTRAWLSSIKEDMNRSKKEEVSTLIYEAIQQGPDDDTKRYFTGAGIEGLSVGDYAFADLDGDGVLELIASVDLAGRPLFNTLVVVTRKDGTFAYKTIESSGPDHDLSQELQDLDGDGVLELFVKDRWSAFLPEPRLEEAFDESGQYTLPDTAWIDIYHWSDEGFANVSDRFNNYYQEKYLSILQQTIEKIQQFSQAPLEDKEALSSQYQVGLFKVQRLVGHKNAGLSQAKVWARSTNEVLVESAIRVFSDIGDRDAIMELGHLAKNRNGVVAEQAQFSLKVIGAKKSKASQQ